MMIDDPADVRAMYRLLRNGVIAPERGGNYHNPCLICRGCTDKVHWIHACKTVGFNCSNIFGHHRQARALNA